MPPGAAGVREAHVLPIPSHLPLFRLPQRSAALDRQQFITAILNQRGTRIAQQFLHRVFTRHAVATEYLQGIAGHFKRRLGARDLAGHCGL